MKKVKDIKDIFSSINRFIKNNSENLFKSTCDRILDLTGEKFKEKIENVISKEGVLRIGIVGQVKSGKSSFINALLFDGKDILPKASTPMTAALTVIKYSKEISAEVEFYSKADWDIIERKAKDYEKIYRQVEIDLNKNKKIFEIIKKTEVEAQTKHKVGDAIYSSYEVYMMAKRSGLNIAAHIGKTQTISQNVSSINELVGKLQDYVGADGKYTPITRNTNLYLDIPILKGIELIDTPGTNDPIISRGLITRDFLSQCDTVFLLSYSGQFMGKEDAEFLVNTLPAEGISNIMLLGSKFDSVLVDEFKKYKGDIRPALSDLYTKLSYQAEGSLGKIIASNPNKPIMAKIKSKKVKFISGICYSIAKKNKRNLDVMENHALKILEQRYYKIKFSNDILFQLANIDSIRDNDLAEIKNNKDNILSSKLDDFILGQKNEVLNQLNYFKSNIGQRLKELENSDIDELSQQAKLLEEGFDSAEEGIKQIFIDFKFNVKDNIYQLIKELDEKKDNYTNLSIDTDSREVYSHTSGMWWWEETHYETEYYKIANVNDAVDKSVKFIKEANEAINYSWVKLINIENIETKLTKEATNGFDLGDTSFNKNKIINPVKNALREIKIKPYKLKDRKYKEQITSTFSTNEVEGSDINCLKSTLSNVLYDIVENIEETLENKLDEISTLLDNKSNDFISDIKKDSNKTISKLKNDLRDKEAAKRRDLSLIDDINYLKNSVM